MVLLAPSLGQPVNKRFRSQDGGGVVDATSRASNEIQDSGRDAGLLFWRWYPRYSQRTSVVVAHDAENLASRDRINNISHDSGSGFPDTDTAILYFKINVSFTRCFVDQGARLSFIERPVDPGTFTGSWRSFLRTPPRLPEGDMEYVLTSTSLVLSHHAAPAPANQLIALWFLGRCA